MKIFFVILFFTKSAMAAEILQCGVWKVDLVKNKDQIGQIQFIDVDTQNLISEYTAEHQLSKLIEQPECFSHKNKMYLITKWSSGAKSERLVILDPHSTKVEALNVISWDFLDYKIKDGKLRITSYLEPRESSEKPITVIRSWPQ